VTVVIGVLNVTPDSFSDGGKYVSLGAAVDHAVELTGQGADYIDVGGESTRPGAVRVPAEIEQERVIPVVRALTDRGIGVSIDTMNGSTARAAADAGAQIINDVSGGLADPWMQQAVIDSGLRFVVMHWRGQADVMDSLAHYVDTASDVRRELLLRVTELVEGGVDPAKIIVDPGLGFAKDSAQNWELLAHLPVFRELGYPVLVGASRKRFVAEMLPDGMTMEDRDEPSAVISALAAFEGAWGVRVHNVLATRIALNVVEAWQAGRGESSATTSASDAGGTH
jgi:dihydropteroate synthase